MGKLFHFISYHNAVPIAISFVLLGAATTYAAANPDKIISKTDRVVSIDNTYIASKDLSRYTPSVKILSVTEDDTSYYIQYTFTTIDLQNDVWQDITTNEALTVDKARLGNYRDLGLFVTQQLKEKIESEVNRLRKTQEIEKGQITQKTIVTKYKGIIGGFLDAKTTKIAGYSPIVKPPKPQKETDTFARPDPDAVARMREHLDLPPVSQMPIALVSSSTQEPDTVSSTTVDQNSGQDQSTTTESTSTSTASSTGQTGTSTEDADLPVNEPPTLELLGDSAVTIFVDDTYTDLGAVATDDHDTDLSITLYVNDVQTDKVALDTSVPAQYTIAYRSTDSDGATAEIQRTVTVVAKEVTATSSASTATSTPEVTSQTSPSTPDAAPGSSSATST